MKKQILFCVSMITLFVSCSENSTIVSEETNIEFSSHQIPGCNHSSTLEKTAVFDSCLAYKFDDVLKLEFCVYGNCCPDSNRFVTNQKIKGDTIFVSVADTAEKLCKCICKYLIHLEVTGLNRDQYVFYCNYDSLLEYKEIIYRK
jgi:hypothetical protein